MSSGSRADWRSIDPRVWKMAFARAVNTMGLSLLYTVNGIGVLVLQVPALALVRRIGIRHTLPWASLLDAAGFAIIGFATGAPSAALAMMTLTCAEVIFDPSQQTAIAELADPAHRGQTYGVVGLAQTLGIAVAPLIGGLLLDLYGDHHILVWVTIATFGLGQAACFAAFVRRREPSLNVQSARGFAT